MSRNSEQDVDFDSGSRECRVPNTEVFLVLEVNQAGEVPSKHWELGY